MEQVVLCCTLHLLPRTGNDTKSLLGSLFAEVAASVRVNPRGQFDVGPLYFRKGRHRASVEDFKHRRLVTDCRIDEVLLVERSLVVRALVGRH